MYTYNCKILNVVDGDTLDIEIDLGFTVRIKERVRLLGIDTPEVFGKEAEPAGQLASQFTKAWVAKRQGLLGGFTYESVKYNAKDKYGRSLGIISWADPLNKKEILNEDLLAAGQAKKYT